VTAAERPPRRQRPSGTPSPPARRRPSSTALPGREVDAGPEIGRRAAAEAAVPVVVQTNEQADDMVRGFLADLRDGRGTGLTVGRLHAAQYAVPPDVARDPSTRCSSDIRRWPTATSSSPR
jgi:hypothetical protein